MSKIKECQSLLDEIATRRGLTRECVMLLTMSVLAKQNDRDSFTEFRANFDAAIARMYGIMDIVENGEANIGVSEPTCQMILRTPGYDQTIFPEIRDFLNDLVGIAEDVDNDRPVDHGTITDMAARLPDLREKWARVTDHIKSVLANWQAEEDSDAKIVVTVDKALGEMTNLTSAINMVAINAWIEANRAGEHGAGFKVLATEIHRLSDRAGQTLRLARAAIGS